MTFKLACVFPGQGSQSVGMLDDFSGLSQVAQLLAVADDRLGEPLLSTMIAKGPAEQLGLTVNTQPAMLLAGLACYQAWLGEGGASADIVAGHSLGEYTALVAAGALSIEDAIPLTRLRAEAMQSAVPVGVGAMAAVLGMDAAAVIKVCEQASAETDGEEVVPANFNAPLQTVIAGHSKAVARACEIAKESGAKRALPLAVSAPFHSSLLKPAGVHLASALAEIEIKSPDVPLVNNVDVAVLDEPDAIRDALVRQSYSPVRWVEVMQKIKSMGATHMIEFGPGKVLTGLSGRIDKSIKAACVFDKASLAKAMESFTQS